MYLGMPHASIDMPEELPRIPQPISIRSKCDNRFFLNYCTFPHTTPYWKRSHQERPIDWMGIKWNYDAISYQWTRDSMV
ncbi:hypothetical protein NXX56_29120 [Bacteroides thetaiotaomicron]|nr:hypothetical protein [Bacteroides thetaiotaomicron]